MAPIFYKEQGQTELRAMWPQARKDKEGSERFYVDLSFLDIIPNSIFIAGVVGLVHADTCQMKLYNGKVASCLSDLGQDGSKERPLIIWGKPLSGTPTSGASESMSKMAFFQYQNEDFATPIWVEDSLPVDLSFFPVRNSYGKLSIGGAWGFYDPVKKCTTCSWAQLQAALGSRSQDGTLKRPVRISNCTELFKIPSDVACKDAAEADACEASPAVKAAADAPEGEWDVVSRGGASDT